LCKHREAHTLTSRSCHPRASVANLPVSLGLLLQLLVLLLLLWLLVHVQLKRLWAFLSVTPGLCPRK
jgi:hypothetical protein